MQNFQNFGTQVSDRFNQQAGLSISIPIFNRNRTRSAVTQSEIALRQAELDNKQSSIKIVQTLISDYSNVVAAAAHYQTAAVNQITHRPSF